jgi:hypothetical protein
MKINLHLSTENEEAFEEFELPICDIREFITLLRGCEIFGSEGRAYKFDNYSFDAHSQYFEIYCKASVA